MVVGSQESWKKWRDLSKSERSRGCKAQKEYDAFTGLYNKNTELTVNVSFVFFLGSKLKFINFEALMCLFFSMMSHLNNFFML